MKKQIASIMLIFALVLTMVAVPLAPSDIAYGAGEYVAQVNGVKYTSLEAAVTAAESLATEDQEEDPKVNLLADVNLDAPITIEEEIEIDLQGKSIAMAGINQRAFTVSSLKALAISDSVGTGAVEGEIYLDDKSGLLIISGVMDLENVKYYSEGDSVLAVLESEEDSKTYDTLLCFPKEVVLTLGANQACQGVYFLDTPFDDSVDASVQQLKSSMGLDGEFEKVSNYVTLYFVNPIDGVIDYYHHVNVKIGETISEALSRVDRINEEYQLDLDKYEEPTFPGAVFEGWAYGTDEDNDNYITIGEPISLNKKIVEDTMLYTRWEPESDGVRIYGSNRFETSMEIADALKATMCVKKFDTVVVANGMNFADALAGTYLASVKGAPILTVDTDAKIEAKVKDYIDKNVYDGGTIYLLGGTGVVSTAFEKSLKSAGYNVVRLGGKDRFETNIKILKEAGVTDEDIMVCSAYGFADSLSASAVGLPILLVDDKLTTQQKEYLNGIDTDKFYLIGGKGVVKSTIDNELKAKFGATERVAGDNRFKTSVAVARRFFDKENVHSAIAAYAMDFPDGLAGGPLAYYLGAPLLLVTDNDTIDAVSFTTEYKIADIVPLGGPSLISDWTAFAKLPQY